eukprot:TRINITY_DN20140_c0_g1_i1.p1 TRINITY_DN20140_c0_g1~~TRINITY_DN20140_c0_g1_i1.p1  ORF type:complete len:172 (-),score=40.24 TRINITY_DN20140_c0_g1_i1:215-730(-)
MMEQREELTSTKVIYITSGEIESRIPITLKEPRYKMRQLGVNITIHAIYFTNLTGVSKDLQVPSDYIVNFLATHTGRRAKKLAKQKSKDKSKTDDDWMVYPSSGVTEQILNNAMSEFIHNFVCCPTCRLPELKFSAQIPDQSSQGTKKSSGKKKEKTVVQSRTLAVCRGCP